MTYKNLEKEDLKWSFLVDSTTESQLVFHFDHLPNKWFLNAHKQFIQDCLDMGKPTLATLHRYNYSLKKFYEFIETHNLKIDRFEDLTYQDIQLFLYEIKRTVKSKSTQSIVMSALKKIIEQGMFFDYEGYPNRPIFDGREYKAIGPEDTLSTEYISDNVMSKIENALKKEEDILFKSLLEITIDTGARIGDILSLKEGSLTTDFTGKPILKVYSSKNKSERYIPVSRRVYWAVKRVEELTIDIRERLDTEYIFLYWGKSFTPRRMIQKRARDLLELFLMRNDILSPSGECEVTYHSFRHRLGTDMLNNGMTIFEIQDYLGHDSTHSTSQYAKVKNPKIQKQYKEIGFVGMVIEDAKKIPTKVKSNKKITESDIKSAALPDGICSLPIDKKGAICASFNACILCSRFITTPEHLPVHRNHLKRIRENREDYMKKEFIGTQEHLEKIELTLVEIIKRLEDIKNGPHSPG